MTIVELLVLFLALGLGILGGFMSAYAVHWVLIHRMRGIDGLLRANYAIAKRAETRAERAATNRHGPQTPEEIIAAAEAQGLTTRFPRGE